MSINVVCEVCGDKYFCHTSNTKIYGPTLETKCPKCNRKLIKNMSSFLEAHTVSDTMLGQASLMIARAHKMGLAINDDKPFRKKKKKQ